MVFCLFIYFQHIRTQSIVIRLHSVSHFDITVIFQYNLITVETLCNITVLVEWTLFFVNCHTNITPEIPQDGRIRIAQKPTLASMKEPQPKVAESSIQDLFEAELLVLPPVV